MDVRIGTSGWNYKHWRGVFYPPGLPVARWFDFYARYFDTVEINNTFYRLPPAETFDAWRTQAPPGFLYAVKASRFLTHMKKLKDPEEPVERLMTRACHLECTLGPILYQLPPHWGCDLSRLRDFLAVLPRGFTHVMEFRDPSWYTAAVRELLVETGTSFCIHDMRGSVSPPWVTGPAVYLRFHGPTELKYAGYYGPELLRPWAGRVEEYACQGRSVYAYFNNDNEGYAVRDAMTLREMVAPALA
jgi:uncharacterized protein YecE (DUF72 family)